MKTKKIITLLLILTFLVSEISFINFKNISIAENVNLEEYTKDYYGRQLNTQGKKFYDAMVEMYKKDLLQKGVDYDLVKNGVVSTEDLLKYATGETQLLYDMTAARDAFQYDYPEVFWIDWSAISLRVTRNSQGEYFAFLGRGKRDDYFLPGFNENNVKTAISEYDELMKEAVNNIRQTAESKIKEDDTEESKKYELAKAAHDWEMNKMSYKFEYEVENYNSESKPYSNARTAYDCLRYGEGVCESYTRAFKAILDQLDIPCIVAGGGYRVSDTQTENHAWNYVKIGEKWYGVDVTHDDDDDETRQSHRYFMVGTAELFDRRIESGVFSQSMFKFGFPSLASSSLQEIEEEYDDGLFNVRVITSDYTEEGEHSGDDYGEVLKDTFRVWVSYNKKDYTTNAADGKYILARFATYDDETNAWKYTGWGYITPEIYPALREGVDENLGGYIDFQLPQVQLVQFAVTDVGPKIKTNGLPDLYYTGDPTFLTERTKEFVNETGNIYKAPPYITKATPVQSVKLGFESTFKVRLEYDDYFEAKDGSKEGTVKIADVYKPDGSKRNDLINDSQISNVVYHLGESSSDKAWVEFDFTPSTQFAANEVAYSIEWQGVVGHESQKAPIPACYAVGNKCDFCCLAGQGIDCNVFAQPELMDTSNVSTEGWKTKDENGKEVSLPSELAGADLDKLSHRLTLSTTTVSDEENQGMVDLVKDLDKNTAKTESYNIRMQLCKKQVVKTGNSVRIRLGFPEGTTYEDYISGKREFKVYHYFYDDLGNITGYEEIEVEVVPQGLILYVDSFSPFTIAGIEVPEAEREAKSEEAKKKIVMLSSTEGGYVTYNGSETEKIDMENKDEITITVHPEEGKTIESIAVGSKIVPLANINEEEDGTFTFKVKAEDLSEGNTIIYVKLMSALIVQEDIDENHGEQVEQPEEDAGQHVTDSEGKRLHVVNSLAGKTVEQLISDMSKPGLSFEILDKDGNKIENPESVLIGTGMKIRFSSEGKPDVYSEEIVVVKGDLNGDGNMGATDVTSIKRGFNDESLEGCYFYAADYDGNGEIGSTDVTMIKRAWLEN